MNAFNLVQPQGVLRMRFASRMKMSFAGALTLGAVALVLAVPAQAGHFDYGGYFKKVVIVKKSFAHPSYDFHGGGYVKKVVIVKKRFGPHGYGSHGYGFHGYGPHGYGYPRATTVVVKKHFAHPGYGFHGPRPVGFYGHSRYDDF